MKVLDLFSGLGGWSQAFKDRGHEVVTVDNEARFNPTVCNDIMKVHAKPLEMMYGHFDVILASPPCNCFSVMSISRHWNINKTPKDQATIDSIELVGHTIELILGLHPRFWILENPRGMMRNVLGMPSVTTYFGSWLDKETLDLMKSKSGEKHFHKNYFVLKPTDLWGVLPKSVDWSKPTKWVKASRGARTGTQGVKRAELRALIPYGLSLVVCIACEKEIIISYNKQYENKMVRK